MRRYSAQFRNTILKKLLPPENLSAVSVAKEYHISVTTLYGSPESVPANTLKEGIQFNRERPLAEKISLLLESRGIPEESMGQWLREQEMREAVSAGEEEAREELKAAKQKIREQERELKWKEKAPAEAAIIITTQKKNSAILQEPEAG